MPLRLLLFLLFGVFLQNWIQAQERSVLMKIRNEFEKGRIRNPQQSLRQLQQLLENDRSMGEDDRAISKFLMGQSYVEMEEFD